MDISKVVSPNTNPVPDDIVLCQLGLLKTRQIIDFQLVGNEGPIISLRSDHESREHDWMDETAKRTEPQTGDAAANSDAATVAETIARKAGSVVGAVASMVSGSHTPNNSSSEKRTQAARSEQSKPNVDAYAKRRLEIKKKKKAAHRRRLKASHAKG